ncbi:hypothetical protein F5Y16DRAFT_402145 [Xylariaceae sp. FL0255]|nr:hypothetical protein F5Y16DRAFT_402145 [Xylariaceae sp. FL0255]
MSIIEYRWHCYRDGVDLLPHNFICQTNPALLWEPTFGCTSSVQSPSLETVVSVVSDGVTTRATTVLLSTDGINAFSIEVRYQSTDFVPITTSSATPTEPASTSAIPTQTAAAQSAALSSGAIAGIAVGTGVAVIFASILLFMILRRRHRRQPTPVQPAENSYSQAITEYTHSVPHELDASAPIQELGDDRIRQGATRTSGKGLGSREIFEFVNNS